MMNYKAIGILVLGGLGCAIMASVMVPPDRCVIAGLASASIFTVMWVVAHRYST